MKHIVPFLFLGVVMSCGTSTDKPSTTEESAEETYIEEVAEEAAPMEAAEEAAAEEGFASYSQTVYQLDTVGDQQVIKELKSHQTFDTSDQTNFCTTYSFDFMDGDGTGERCRDFDLPIEYYTLKEQFSAVKDSTFTVNGTQLTFDNKGDLVKMRMGLSKIHIDYNGTGDISKALIGSIDERSEEVSWIMIKRDYRENLPTPYDYLTVDGVDVFTKEKRSIVDYYAMMVKAGRFTMDHAGGTFDVPNGYFSIADEGTGAGLYVQELVLFRSADGTDFIALNSRSEEPVSYMVVTSPEPPRFFTLDGYFFTPRPDVFPQLDQRVFFPEEYAGDTKIEAYYALPRKGLSITYAVNGAAVDFCDQLESKDDNYKIYEDRCKIYSALEKSEIQLEFDKSSGAFALSD